MLGTPIKRVLSTDVVDTDPPLRGLHAVDVKRGAAVGRLGSTDVSTAVMPRVT